jgi:hypothetical protein
MEACLLQAEVAKQIAIDAGALAVCTYHDIAYDNGGEIESAYKLANARYTAGKYDDVSGDRREMTDAIQHAVGESADSCWRCDKWK